MPTVFHESSPVPENVETTYAVSKKVFRPGYTAALASFCLSKHATELFTQALLGKLFTELGSKQHTLKYSVDQQVVDNDYDKNGRHRFYARGITLIESRRHLVHGYSSQLNFTTSHCPFLPSRKSDPYRQARNHSCQVKVRFASDKRLLQEAWLKNIKLNIFVSIP